jgi:hypothetical protein
MKSPLPPSLPSIAFNKYFGLKRTMRLRKAAQDGQITQSPEQQNKKISPKKTKESGASKQPTK